MPPRHSTLQERRLAPPSLLHHHDHSDSSYPPESRHTDSHDSYHPTNQDLFNPRRPVIHHSSTSKIFYRPSGRGGRGGREVKGRPVILHLQSQRQSHHETDDDDKGEQEEEQELLQEQQEEQKSEHQSKGWYKSRPVIRHPGKAGVEVSKTEEFRPWTSDLGPRSIPADTVDGNGSVLRKRSLDATTSPPPPTPTSSSSLTDSNLDLDLDSLLPTTTTPTPLDCPLDLQKALPKFKKYRPTNPADIAHLARLANSGCGGRATTLWYQDLPVGINGLPDGAAGSVVGILFAVFSLVGMASVVSIARIWLRERKERG